WMNLPEPNRSGGPLNLLLVPFPYSIGDRAVVGRGVRRAERWGRFTVRPSWFPPGNFGASSEALAVFIDELVVEAERTGAPVHGVVLPELALDHVHAQAIAHALQYRD